MAIVENARLKIKRSTVSGVVPTIPPSEDHADGTWSSTDIYEGEFFINLVDRKIWTREPSGIFQVYPPTEDSLKFFPADNTSVNGDDGDKTRRLMLSTYQQASPSNPFGDLIRLIEEHGSAKGGIKFYSRGMPAKVISSNSEPFAVNTGDTLQVKVNGSATKTITFQAGTGQTLTSGAATADEISNIITKQLNYTSYPSGEVDPSYYAQSFVYLTQSGTSVNDDALKVAICSCTYGTSSSIEIVGGTAAAALGFSVGVTNGTAGAIDMGDGSTADQLAWLIAHHFPNDPASNNSHQHISIEVPDSSGAMQTRLSIAFWKDVTEILLSSAMLIVNGYPVTISNDAEGYKDVDWSKDNTGRKIARRFQVRLGQESTGGNTSMRVFDDSGVATNMITFNRLKKFMSFGGAFQGKIRSTTNNTAVTLSLSPQNGNSFVIAGTTNQISYISYSEGVTNGWTWQAGSVITIVLQGAATLKHNAGTGSAGVSGPLCLQGSADFTSGANGSIHDFLYEGPTYGNRWLEKSRLTY